MSEAPRSWLPCLLLGALALSAVGFRLAIAPQSPTTFDEVSFLLALEHYDLLAFEPHFPGYPLAVLLARGADALGAPAPYAALNALVLPPALVAVGRLAGGSWRGLWAAAIFAWAPLAVHESLRPMADTLAMSLVLIGVAALLPRRGGAPSLGALFAGALFLGAAAAAKPDHALFLSFLVLPSLRQPRRSLAVAGVCTCVLAWGGFGLLALSAGCGGVEPALAEGQRFLAGHLGEWGGVEASAPRILHALAPLGDFAPRPGLAADSLALRLATVLALGALALRSPRSLRRAVLIGGLPYAAWLLFGQTLSHPRHALALLPLLLVLAGRGLPRSRPALALAVLLLVGALNATGWRASTWAEGARPLDRVVAWLSEQPPSTRLYAAGSARALRERLPTHDVRRARDLAGARADLGATPISPRRVYVLPELLQPEAQGLPLPLPLPRR